MLQSVLIKRGNREGEYDDVIDVADHFKGRFGGAANALCQMAKESPTFRAGLAELSKTRRKPRHTD